MCYSKNIHDREKTSHCNNMKIMTWNVEGYMTKNNDEGVCNKLNVS